MQNLSQEITHSLYFLNNCKNNLQTMARLLSEYTNRIDKVQVHIENYGGLVRWNVKEFYKDFNKEYEKFIYGYKLFMQEIVDINANKSDELVIYNLERFRTSLLWFIQFKKLIKKITSPILMKKDAADMKCDYVKLIAYKKLESALIKETEMVNRIMRKLSILTGMEI